MFLFGRFRFWAPICFPEIISSRYDPKFERLLEANWRKAAQRTFRIFDYFTAYNTVFPPNILVRKFCGKAQFPHSFGGLAQNYAETVPLYKISIPGNSVKSRYFTKFLLGSFRIMVFQEIGTLKEEVQKCHETVYKAKGKHLLLESLFKNVTSPHERLLLLIKLQKFTKGTTPPWEFFTFFKLFKWYQIVQSIAYDVPQWVFRGLGDYIISNRFVVKMYL